MPAFLRVLAKVRQTLQDYCEATGRPLESVKRWYRKLPEEKKGVALRNIEVANARNELGIVGPDSIKPAGLILP